MSLMAIVAGRGGHLSDKWMQYLTIYEREIGALAAGGRPLRLLEIGVQNGGSLAIWEQYLPQGSEVVGVDIDARCAALAFEGNVRVVIADAGDATALADAVGPGAFDVIIDDGSHVQSDIINSLAVLWDRVSPGGLYIIEDLHCAYWASHGGGYRHPGSAIEHLKSWIEALNLDHVGADAIADPAGRDDMQLLNAELARLTFYDSVAVLEKYAEPKRKPFSRVLSGQDMTVTGPGALAAVIANGPAGFLFSDQALHAMDGPVTAALQTAIDAQKAVNADLTRELEAMRRAADVARVQADADRAGLTAELQALRLALNRVPDSQAQAQDGEGR